MHRGKWGSSNETNASFGPIVIAFHDFVCFWPSAFFMSNWSHVGLPDFIYTCWFHLQLKLSSQSIKLDMVLATSLCMPVRDYIFIK